MGFQDFNTCCYKAFKHGETTCPVCGSNLFDANQVLSKLSKVKAAVLVPVFALTMHSCNEVNETGIVKDKIDNQVFLTPVNDTNYVYRVIEFDDIRKDRQTKNIYLNMNRGDTVLFHNYKDAVEVKASYYHSAILGGGHRYYNVLSINGVRCDSLPDLVYKQKYDAEIKRLNERYQNLHNQNQK